MTRSVTAIPGTPAIDELEVDPLTIAGPGSTRPRAPGAFSARRCRWSPRLRSSSGRGALCTGARLARFQNFCSCLPLRLSPCGCLLLVEDDFDVCLPLGVGKIFDHNDVCVTDRLPDFLIVGAARCGTTWLARNLALHPDVFVPHCKEIHFFDKHFGNGIDWYKSFFAGRPEGRVGEATPRYLSAEHVPGLIHRHVPGASIIILLRNPVDRAYSHHWNLVGKARRRRRPYRKSFEENLFSSASLLREGFYTEKIERYRQLFPRENIKTIVYDDLVRDPDGLLREIYRFLAIDLEFQSNLSTYRLNAAESKLGRSIMLFRLYRGLLRLRLAEPAKWIDDLNKRAPPPMKMKTRTMLLRRYYLREIERLEEILARDLSAWKT